MQRPRNHLTLFDAIMRRLSDQVSAYTYYHGLADTSILPSFNTAAHAFSPESLTAQVMPLLRRKRAMSYSGSPLWLALYMSDPLGIPQLSLSSLRRVPLDFSHFSKLFLGDQRSLLVYTVE